MSECDGPLATYAFRAGIALAHIFAKTSGSENEVQSTTM